MARELTVTEALRIVSAVVMVATGTKESDVAADLRPSALSLDVVYRALAEVHLACNTSTEVIDVYLPGAPCVHGFAPGACAVCWTARKTLAEAAVGFKKK